MCDDFVRAALSSNTTTDSGPADARRRAVREHGTPELAERLNNGVRTNNGVDRTWLRLAAHRARIRVTTSPVADDPPPSTTTVAAAAVLANRTAIGNAADGSPWREPMPDVVAHCTLTRHDDGRWLVADLTLDTASITAPTTQPARGGGR